MSENTRGRKRIFLIHATPLAMSPINEAFARLWPEAELCNLLEDSLPRDLSNAGHLTTALKERFMSLAGYAQGAGADAILFTCSAFGEAIDLCKGALSIPVLKPNEAMLEEALDHGGRIALLATFAPSIDSISEEIKAAVELRQTKVTVQFVPGAMAALQALDTARHDQLVSEMVGSIADADVICFAQFSMTTAASLCMARTDKPVLTTPDSAVRKLRHILGEGGHVK
ncbi:aspartate/glutamate racemase family protein [Pseudomonas monteilii]|uniref:aspartate/glutamate racemase family protein n=1 Tax=Pseudomonas TaxID=286 RepID=UPI0018ABD182|nr:aspartate/glutamate racemase family protein [Pseudomonas monteilii]MBF8747655.1 arylsulfatase [Pseudomonas monteilii]